MSREKHHPWNSDSKQYKPSTSRMREGDNSWDIVRCDLTTLAHGTQSSEARHVSTISGLEPASKRTKPVAIANDYGHTFGSDLRCDRCEVFHSDFVSNPEPCKADSPRKTSKADRRAAFIRNKSIILALRNNIPRNEICESFGVNNDKVQEVLHRHKRGCLEKAALKGFI